MVSDKTKNSLFVLIAFVAIVWVIFHSLARGNAMLSLFAGIGFCCLIFFWKPKQNKTPEPEIIIVEPPAPNHNALVLICFILIFSCFFCVLWWAASDKANTRALKDNPEIVNKFNLLLEDYCTIIRKCPDSNVSLTQNNNRQWVCPLTKEEQLTREMQKFENTN